jgi:AcrR family transcriptional regulator
MAKAGRRSATRGTESSRAARDRLVEAAFQTVREEGFTGASARAIAARAGVNPALIFYYFDSVNDLLIEALAHSSRAQLGKYQQALARVGTPAELVTALRGRLVDDMASGHVKVVAELVCASSADEDLRAAVFEQVTPWMEFAGQTLDRVLGNSGLGGLTGLVPLEEMSFLVVALFLGMELLAEVAGNGEVMGRLLDSAERVSGVLGNLLPAGGAR